MGRLQASRCRTAGLRLIGAGREDGREFFSVRRRRGVVIGARTKQSRSSETFVAVVEHGAPNDDLRRSDKISCETLLVDGFAGRHQHPRHRRRH